jgi:hypothetical protein
LNNWGFGLRGFGEMVFVCGKFRVMSEMEEWVVEEKVNEFWVDGERSNGSTSSHGYMLLTHKIQT